jgi:hypothetical protein
MRARRSISVIAALSLTVALAAPSTGAHGVPIEDVDVLYTLSVEGGVQLGWAVSELTDIDGDGVTDLIVSDDLFAGEGAAFVFSGATGALIHTLSGGPGRFGYAIADAGDVDADGTHDIVAGQPGANSARVFSGLTGEEILTLTSPSFEAVGVAVSSAGDINADGHADLLVGAQFGSANGLNAGRAYIFSGADGSVLRAYDGSAAGDLFGTATDWVADIDGDGHVEHAIGARDAGKWDDGGVWVYSGRTGALLWSFRGPKQGDELGSFFVAGLDDLTGDGVPDVYAGDYAATTNGRLSGEAYVLSGADGSVFRTRSGDSAKDGLGPGREGGDLDGDGVQDLVVGSWTSSDAVDGGGKFQVFSGADGSTLGTVLGTTPGTNLGFDAVGIGDVDGDGTPDLLVSAARGAVAYVVSGASVIGAP